MSCFYYDVGQLRTALLFERLLSRKRGHGLHYSHYILEDQKEVNEVTLQTDTKKKPRKQVKYSSRENKTETPQETTQLILRVGMCSIVLASDCFVRVCVCVHFLQCDVVRQ